MYRPINYLGWIMTVVGLILLSTLKADSGKAKWAVYQIMGAIGIGLNVSRPFSVHVIFENITNAAEHTVGLSSFPDLSTATSDARGTRTRVL